uniref:Uncharacterized protein n=1 Tax=Oryza meridionalis TaxID=40149 RepID=A0A0E0D670_9ORYZ
MSCGPHARAGRTGSRQVHKRRRKRKGKKRALLRSSKPKQKLKQIVVLRWALAHPTPYRFAHTPRIRQPKRCPPDPPENPHPNEAKFSSPPPHLVLLSPAPTTRSASPLAPALELLGPSPSERAPPADLPPSLSSSSSYFVSSSY